MFWYIDISYSFILRIRLNIKLVAGKDPMFFIANWASLNQWFRLAVKIVNASIYMILIEQQITAARFKKKNTFLVNFL